MKLSHILLYLIFIYLGTLGFSESSNTTNKSLEEMPIIELPDFDVDGTLEEAGFSFTAKFRHHLIFAGVKKLVVVEVGPDSVAHKAGIRKGDQIIKIEDTKVFGMGIRKMIKAFKKESENGIIKLTIRSKHSDKDREIDLNFNFSTSKKSK